MPARPTHRQLLLTKMVAASSTVPITILTARSTFSTFMRHPMKISVNKDHHSHPAAIRFDGDQTNDTGTHYSPSRTALWSIDLSPTG